MSTKIRYRHIFVCLLFTLLTGLSVFIQLDIRSSPVAQFWQTTLLNSSTALISRFPSFVRKEGNQSQSEKLQDLCQDPLPQAKPVKQYDLFQYGPFGFLTEFRTPCWQDKNSSFGVSCLPYFYQAGMTKSGTTDLWAKIAMHPGVATVTKEPRWLTRFRFQKPYPGFSKYIGVLSKYLFDEKSKEKDIHKLVLGDSSAETLWRLHKWYLLPGNENCSEPRVLTADYVRHLNPKVKVIVILRNPADRLHSAYKFYSWLYDQTEKTNTTSFHTATVREIGRLEACLKTHSLRHCAYNESLDEEERLISPIVGLYHVFTADWLHRFPRDQIHVLRLEDLSANVTHTMKKVFKFLGLAAPDKTVMDNIAQAKRQNVGELSAKFGPMLQMTRTFLQDFYRPHNQRLADLLKDSRFLWLDDVKGKISGETDTK